MTDEQKKRDLINRLVATLEGEDMRYALDAAWIAMQIVGGDSAAAVVKNYCAVSSGKG